MNTGQKARSKSIRAAFDDGDFRFLGLGSKFERNLRKRFWNFENQTRAGFASLPSAHGLASHLADGDGLALHRIYKHATCPLLRIASTRWPRAGFASIGWRRRITTTTTTLRMMAACPRKRVNIQHVDSVYYIFLWILD